MLHKYIKFIFLISLFFIQGIISINAESAVTDIRWVTRNDAPISYIRTVLELTQSVKAQAEISKDGLNTTIIVKNTNFDKPQNSIKMDKHIIEKVDIKNANRDLLLTFKTPNSLEANDIKIFQLKKNEELKTPWRLVIDIPQKNVQPREHYFGKHKPDNKIVLDNSNKNDSKNKNSVKPKVEKNIPKIVNYRVKGGIKDKIIAIDPGHGGSDVGAIAKDGTYEKDITLPISMELKDLLEKAGAKVVMTRTTDVDVFGRGASDVDELQARADVGNINKADIFISVHINAFTNPNVGGISDYYYSKSPYDKKLAYTIQRHIGNKNGFKGDRGTNETAFYVLSHTLMPAVLVELGFMSNPQELQLLKTKKVQHEFAMLMFEGIKDYFEGV